MLSSSAPIGIRLLRASPCHVRKRDYIYRFYVMMFTFVAFASFHMTRKAISVVGTEWRPNKTSNTSGWSPFNGKNGQFDLGLLDSVFLFAYAFAMFGSGHLGDRVNLTYLLTIGMLGTGVFTVALGIPYFINLHALYFFVVVQVLAGVFQSVGWPTVVAIMTKWFGKGNRGLIFGIWNSHGSVGNILGVVIPGVFVETHWGYSFVVPGLIMVGLGVLVFLFLPSDPYHVALIPPQHHPTAAANCRENEEAEPLCNSVTDLQRGDESEELQRNSKAIGFIVAIKIPGVMEFSLSLFFAKVVLYTFIYWLPTYVKDTLKVKGVSEEQATDLSTFFDVGGICGGVLIGFLADRMKINAVPCVIMQLLCIPELILYNKFGGTSYALCIPELILYNKFGGTSYAFCIGLSFLTGVLVVGPCCLISTAVSADLATHKVLGTNLEAKATVAAIIDGTGSIGAALGPLLCALISEEWGFLLRLVVKEVKTLWQR